MTRYVALLRAINVGGTGKLPMEQLREICRALGFARVETYIASGNVVFDSASPADDVKAALEARLAAHAGAPIGVCIRTGDEMQAICDANPFRDAPGNRTVALFLDAPPPFDAISRATGRADEELRLGLREIFVRYPSGLGASKLKIPAARAGTARNMNTIARLAEMAREQPAATDAARAEPA